MPKLPPTLSELILEYLADAGHAVPVQSILAAVRRSAMTTDGAVRSVLADLKKDGRIEQPKRGYYMLPPRPLLKEKPPQPAAPDPNYVDYPVLRPGVAANFNGRVQNWQGESVRVPKSLIATWTGGTVPGREEAYWTWVNGTSMEPWLPDGTPIFVIVTSCVTDAGRYVLYLDDVDGEVLKRCERIGNNVLLLTSDNPAHTRRVLRRDDEADDNMYRDDEFGVWVNLRIRGRVVHPADTPQAILSTFVQKMAEVIKLSR